MANTLFEVEKLKSDLEQYRGKDEKINTLFAKLDKLSDDSTQLMTKDAKYDQNIQAQYQTAKELEAAAVPYKKDLDTFSPDVSEIKSGYRKPQTPAANSTQTAKAPTVTASENSAAKQTTDNSTAARAPLPNPIVKVANRFMSPPPSTFTLPKPPVITAEMQKALDRTANASLPQAPGAQKVPIDGAGPTPERPTIGAARAAVSPRNSPGR